MSDPHPPTAGIPATATPLPLNDVMLAMDVVDTLRHHQSLVDAELNEEARDLAFAARIKAIYESQGIDVPDEIIARGVLALKEDRFSYRPLERTFAVRLAEVYVERGKWAKVIAVIALAAGILLAATAWSRHQERQERIAGFNTRLGALAAQVQDLLSDTRELESRLAEVSNGEASGPSKDILEDANQNLDRARTALDSLDARMSGQPIVPAEYPDRADAYESLLREWSDRIPAISATLGTARGRVEAVVRIRDLRADVRQILARVTGREIPPPVIDRIRELEAGVLATIDAGDLPLAASRLRELDTAVAAAIEHSRLRGEVARGIQAAESRLRDLDLLLDEESAAQTEDLQQRARNAVDAEDHALASRHLAALDELLAEAEMTYRLLIVAEPGVNSGIWRHPGNDRNVRNYYILVDAVDERGRPVTLPITSEEDQRTRRVSRFGVRVPQDVYEAVRRDKLDNGIIDNRLFGEKTRGTRRPTYRFSVAGGMITEW